MADLQLYITFAVVVVNVFVNVLVDVHDVDVDDDDDCGGGGVDDEEEEEEENDDNVDELSLSLKSNVDLGT